MFNNVDNSSSSSKGKNVLFDDTSSESSHEQLVKNSIEEQSQHSEESKHEMKSKTETKKIGNTNVIVRELESKTTVIQHKPNKITQPIINSESIIEAKKHDQTPVGASKTIKSEEKEEGSKLDLNTIIFIKSLILSIP